MRAIPVIAGLTFREAARKKLLWMALAAGAAFLTLFGIGLHYQAKDLAARSNAIIRGPALESMLMVGLYATDLLAVLMTVLTSVDTLSGELESNTLQALAAKPITRREILLGKWLGLAAMLTVYVLLMTGGIALIANSIGGVRPRHFANGLGLIWLECLLMLSVTLLSGTFLSTLTNGVLALGLHGHAFLGGWVEQAGAALHSPRAVNVGIVASLIMPTESLWRRAAFQMQSPLINALGFSPFSTLSVPSRARIGYALVYWLVALLLALWRFSRLNF
ncbi:MAG TPA: ABC transporter permease [Terriglobia bacterium]|nr:ABC transporter permease [Terriglobia bacterium]